MMPAFATHLDSKRSDSYFLTDVELEAGLRLVALCESGETRSVLFSKMYERALLDGPGGFEYRAYLRERT